MKTRFLKVLFISIALGTMLFACKKEDGPAINTPKSDVPTIDTDLIIDDIAIEALFQNSQAINEEGNSEGANFKKAKTYGCANRTSTSNFADSTATFTYDFDSTVTCTDGQIRSGSFSVKLNSLNFLAKGTKATFTFNNYKVISSTGESYEIVGIRTVENLSDIDTVNGINQQVIVTGLNGKGTNAKIVKKDGATAEWYSNRIRKQTAGATTKSINDDVFEVTGNHGGMSAKGTKYDVLISSAIVGKMCIDKPEPVAGVMDITASAFTYSLDFGDGTCDGKMWISGTAQIMIAGSPSTISIPTQEISINE
jgi:hypothetical protein